MLSWKVKTVVAMLGVATLIQAVPQEADAFIFRWLRERRAARFGCGAPPVRVANFVPTPQPSCGSCAPACPAPCPAPAPCAQQVCSMVPQTCYRTVYRQVPVTTYRPVTTCDPCTGCPRTVMQPCTSVTYQAQRVPVTTYKQVCRMVPTAPACPTCQTPGCSTCPSAVPYAAASPVMPGPPLASGSPGCSSCGVPQASFSVPQAQPQAYPGPATSLSPVPSPSSSPMTVPGPSSSGGAAETAPTLAPGQGQSQGQGQYPMTQGTSARGTVNTYRQPNTLPDLRPLPDLERTNESSAPPLLNTDDRTARLDTVREGAIVPISWEYTAPAQPKVEGAAPAAQTAASTAPPAVKRLDDSGWRPAL